MNIVYQKNAVILVFLQVFGHAKNQKTFLNVIKVYIKAYEHIQGVPKKNWL